MKTNYLCPKCNNYLYFIRQPYYHNEIDFVLKCKICNWYIKKDAKGKNLNEFADSLKLKYEKNLDIICPECKKSNLKMISYFDNDKKIFYMICNSDSCTYYKFINEKELEKLVVDNCNESDCNEDNYNVDKNTNCYNKNSEDNEIYSYGWICPKCGSVYAPHITSCLNCSIPIETKIWF